MDALIELSKRNSLLPTLNEVLPILIKDNTELVEHLHDDSIDDGAWVETIRNAPINTLSY